MITQRWILTLIAFVFLPLSLAAQNYETMRVGSIEIFPQGDQDLNINSLRTKLRTKTGNLFSQSDFDYDLKMLAEEYGRVEPTVTARNGEIYITLKLWFKPTIREIYFCGNERVKSKKLRKALEIEPGEVFDREEFIQGFNKIKALYFKKGYFEADLSYTVIPVEGTHCIDIQIDVCEGRAGKVRKITFCGITRREESEIIDFMLTKKHNFFLSWINGQGAYHPEMVEHDRLQIINFYQNLGYADAMVDLCLDPSAPVGQIQIVITVDRGVPYTFGEVSLSGNTLYSDTCIWDLFQICPGGWYSPEKLRCTVQAVSDLYGGCGYIDTIVDIQLSLREDCPVYDVDVVIDEGDQYYVGLIKIIGNACTHTSVVLHESLLCPGEIFNKKRLEGTETRLLHTGLFSQVNVYAVQSQISDPNGEHEYRDVYIEVEEGDTGNIGLFCGFSSLDRIFGGFEVTERNFNLAGMTRVFQDGLGAIRGGGEFAHFKANIGDKQTSYVLQWTKPYFMDTPWIVGIEVEKSNNRALSSGYELKTYGGSVHGTYIINDYLKYDIHYRARHTDSTIVDSSNVQLAQQAGNTGFISGTGATAIYDSTDHPRRASCGFRSRLSFELVGLGGNYQFMKFGYLNTYYIPASKRGTFKFRGDIQFIKTYGSTDPTDIPLSERFFLGGETTVRGYRPFIIGPLFGPNEPAGGVSSMLLSEEYQHNLIANPCLDGFVFVDAGYVSLSEFTIGRHAASAGFGIRVEVMRNMPIMLGLGWPIHPSGAKIGTGQQKTDNAQRFFFSMGGSF